MKLTPKEAEFISKSYGIGNILAIKPMSTGKVNNSFDFKTTKGDYIIQIIGDEYTAWRQKRMNLQFRLLNYLKNKNFPYGVPTPLSLIDSKDKCVLKINKKYVRINKKVEGKVIKKFKKKHFKEAVKGLALFHKYSKNFDWGGKDDSFSLDFEVLSKEYEKISEIKPRSEIDKLILKNVPMFHECLHQLKKMDFGKKQTIHTDPNDTNILFKGDKLSGIIDFDSIELSPIAKDIVLASERIKYPYKENNLKKIKLYAHEYRKSNNLSKKEESLMIPLLIWANCGFLIHYYFGLEKTNKRRNERIRHTIKETKMFAKLMGWIK